VITPLNQQPTPAAPFPPSRFQHLSFSPFSLFSLASFAPAHVALRAACGRLPAQRPLARVQVSGFSIHLSNFSFSASQFFSILY
jgi:hypothetical protein